MKLKYCIYSIQWRVYCLDTAQILLSCPILSFISCFPSATVVYRVSQADFCN